MLSFSRCYFDDINEQSGEISGISLRRVIPEAFRKSPTRHCNDTQLVLTAGNGRRDDFRLLNICSVYN